MKDQGNCVSQEKQSEWLQVKHRALWANRWIYDTWYREYLLNVRKCMEMF